MMKWIMVAAVATLAIGINMPDNILVRYGVSSSALTVALAAIAFTGMIAYRKLGLVFIMVLLLVGANLPESVAANFRLDRDILLATLIAMIVMPFVQRHIED